MLRSKLRETPLLTYVPSPVTSTMALFSATKVNPPRWRCDSTSKTSTSAFKYPPSNKTAKLPPKLAGYAIPEASLANMVPLDWTKINANRQKYLERWNKEVLA